jgi:hypothetical protein
LPHFLSKLHLKKNNKNSKVIPHVQTWTNLNYLLVQSYSTYLFLNITPLILWIPSSKPLLCEREVTTIKSLNIYSCQGTLATSCNTSILTFCSSLTTILDTNYQLGMCNSYSIGTTFSGSEDGSNVPILPIVPIPFLVRSTT